MKLDEIQPHIRLVNDYGSKNRYIQRERIIYDFEFMYILNGSITMYYGDKRYDLKKSDLFYLEPFVKNHTETHDNVDLQTHCIHFDWQSPLPEYDFKAEEIYGGSVITAETKKFIERLLKRDAVSPEDFDLPNHMTNLPYETFAPLFSGCYYSFIGNYPGAKAEMKSYFFKLISELAHIYGGGDSPRTMHPKIIKAIGYIQRHYTEKLTVSALSAKYSVSEKYFGTLFREATGQSMNSFVNSIRISEAKRLLAGTSLSVDKIAESLGYSNSFYFSRCFKKSEGFSPSQFRNMI